jgi:hypothetical protein
MALPVPDKTISAAWPIAAKSNTHTLVSNQLGNSLTHQSAIKNIRSGILTQPGMFMQALV